MKSAIFTLLASLPLVTLPQTMVESTFTGQPLSNTENGVTVGCGIRVVGIPVNPASSFILIDVSLNIYDVGRALAKVTAAQAPAGLKSANDLRPLPIYNAWFRIDGSAPAAPKGDLFEGETVQSKLFIVDAKVGIETLMGMAFEEPLKIAISTVKGLETISFGKVTLSEQEREQFVKCTTELLGTRKK